MAAAAAEAGAGAAVTPADRHDVLLSAAAHWQSPLRHTTNMDSATGAGRAAASKQTVPTGRSLYQRRPSEAALSPAEWGEAAPQTAPRHSDH